jgi:epoxyqueuosine reductase QueG
MLVCPLQMSIKKNATAREAALKEQQELPNPIYVPLPVWKETKERIRMQMDGMRRGCHERSREWEQKEQVGRRYMYIYATSPLAWRVCWVA